MTRSLAMVDYQLLAVRRQLAGGAELAVRTADNAQRTTGNRQPTRGPRPRRGISLLEVLISMFVLLFGLMGVAAIFPVGNHYAGRGDQFERGAALADAAFAQLKSRGLLRPDKWLYADMPPTADRALGGNDHRFVQPVVAGKNQPAPAPYAFNLKLPVNKEPGPGYAFVIDPLGASAARADLRSNRQADKYDGADVFPYTQLSAQFPAGDVQGNEQRASNTPNPWGSLPGARWPLRRLTIPTDNTAMPTTPPDVARDIVALHDDLATDLPDQSDRPGIQNWSSADRHPVSGNANNTPDDPSDDTPLARSFTGNYSWLATVVPTTVFGVPALQPAHPMYGSELYEVSVAVFYKRVATPGPDTERSITAELQSPGQLVIYARGPAVDAVEAVDNAVEDVRAGNWIALSGVHPQGGRCLLKWYRILSIEEETSGMSIAEGTVQGRRLMLDGPDWPIDPTQTTTFGYPVRGLRAIILPGIIGVSTQYLPMEPIDR